MRHQDDTSTPRPLSEADRRWLDDALKSVMVDLGKRMADIKDTLDTADTADVGGSSAAGEAAAAPAASLEEREQLLDELKDLVEQIDLARGAQQPGLVGGRGCRSRGTLAGPGGFRSIRDALRCKRPLWSSASPPV